MTSDVTFYYIAEGERLQAQALLLAASLQRTQGGAAQIAYLPEGSDVPEGFRDAMQVFGAECRPLPCPEGTWRGPYRHGNKILAAAQVRETQWSVFLDTDMLAIKPLDASDLPEPMQVGVVPEGILGWGAEPDRWTRVYGHFGLPVPEERIRLLRGARRMSPPYFNGGFVAVREGDRQGGRSFGEWWLDTARAIDWNVAVGGKRPWLDQASLPVAMARGGFAHRVLDERNNTSISNGRRLDGLDPAILHYHRAGFLRVWPGADALIAATVEAAPGTLRDRVAAMLTVGGFVGSGGEG